MLIEAVRPVRISFGRRLEPADLLTAVAEVVGGGAGRINLRNPGVLVLSPGNALAGFDEALIEALKAACSAGAPEPRPDGGGAGCAWLQEIAGPAWVRFGYVFFPVGNRHYRGESPLQMGG